MKKYNIFVLLVLSILFVNSIALAEGQVVIYYEGFEDRVEGERIPGWVNIGATWYVSSLQARAGQKSLFIEDTTETNYAGAKTTSIPVSPNTKYTLAVWAMSDDTVWEQGIIAVAITGNGLSTQWLSFPNDRPLEWTLRTKTFTTSSTTKSIILQFYPTAMNGVEPKGQVWFDEIYLVEGGEFVPPQLKPDKVISFVL